MKIALPVLLLLPAVAFAQDKPPLQQATEAIAMEQLSAHQLALATSIANKAAADQYKKQFDDATAQIDVLKKANDDAAKKATDLEAKLALADAAQKEQAAGSDKTIRTLEGQLKAAVQKTCTHGAQ